MEKIAELLIFIAVICSILLAIVIIVSFLHYRHSKNVAKKLLNESERNANLVYQLLKTAFPASRIIRHPALVMPNKQRIPSDLIMVESGGVYVFRIKNVPGMIDNSNKTVWTTSNRNGVFDFQNPFEQNKLPINAIEYILKRENIYNVPKYNIVVFTPKRVSFKIRNEHLTTADRLIDTVKDINSNRFLNAAEINTVLNAIKKYSSR